MVSIEREVIINIGIVVGRDIEEEIIRKRAENTNIGNILAVNIYLTIYIEEEAQVKARILHPLVTLQNLPHHQMRKERREKGKTRRKLEKLTSKINIMIKIIIERYIHIFREEMGLEVLLMKMLQSYSGMAFNG